MTTYECRGCGVLVIRETIVYVLGRTAMETTLRCAECGVVDPAGIGRARPATAAETQDGAAWLREARP